LWGYLCLQLFKVHLGLRVVGSLFEDNPPFQGHLLNIKSHHSWLLILEYIKLLQQFCLLFRVFRCLIVNISLSLWLDVRSQVRHVAFINLICSLWKLLLIRYWLLAVSIVLFMNSWATIYLCILNIKLVQEIIVCLYRNTPVSFMHKRNVRFYLLLLACGNFNLRRLDPLVVRISSIIKVLVELRGIACLMLVTHTSLNIRFSFMWGCLTFLAVILNIRELLGISKLIFPIILSHGIVLYWLRLIFSSIIDWDLIV